MRAIVTSMKGKTILITGASRGTGKAIALRCARDGANLALVARSDTKPSHAQLSGSLQDTKALALEHGAARVLTYGVDIRDSDVVHNFVEYAAQELGASMPWSTMHRR